MMYPSEEDLMHDEAADRGAMPKESEASDDTNQPKADAEKPNAKADTNELNAKADAEKGPVDEGQSASKNGKSSRKKLWQRVEQGLSLLLLLCFLFLPLYEYLYWPDVSGEEWAEIELTEELYLLLASKNGLTKRLSLFNETLWLFSLLEEKEGIPLLLSELILLSFSLSGILFQWLCIVFALLMLLLRFLRGGRESLDSKPEKAARTEKRKKSFFIFGMGLLPLWLFSFLKMGVLRFFRGYFNNASGAGGMTLSLVILLLSALLLIVKWKNYRHEK